MPDNDISQGGNGNDAEAQVPIEPGGTFTPGADDDSGLGPHIVSQDQSGIVSQDEPGIVSQDEPGPPGEG